ncbi:hypothetical protein O6H91_03G077800 [Diphasiastrum complanatum]|uniref:Uncharacterized protein n=1 Tax=Diphasiastrum complanatum TaxID=34168 RepID=A0ACC2E8C8_DIPCM|nr:hypothetical protein O6H91_03G077800 [Diphasiastrum complanatum]
MDISLPMLLESNKRAREEDLAFCEEISDQEPVGVKKLCTGFEIEETNISSIFETGAEGHGSYDQGELDEAQERLVFGVMRSLEEELGIPKILSFSVLSSVDEKSTSLLDSRDCSAIEDAHCSNVKSEDVNSSRRPGDKSYSSQGSFPSVGARGTDLLEQPFQVTEGRFPQSIGTVIEEHSSCSMHDKSPQNKKNMDIGYLLEASDDELGILPSPSSESPSSKVDLVSNSFQGAHETFTESSYDPGSCEYEWDWLSGGHFEFELECVPASQEWIESAVSNLKAGLNPSMREPSALDGAAAVCKESACASY